jgi:hypothetical protein
VITKHRFFISGEHPMTNHLRVFLTPAEYTALLKVSQEELRAPTDQARHILRLELTRRGALSTEAKEPAAAYQPEERHDA